MKVKVRHKISEIDLLKFTELNEIARKNVVDFKFITFKFTIHQW